jgi:cytochrome c peroxidase
MRYRHRTAQLTLLVMLLAVGCEKAHKFLGAPPTPKLPSEPEEIKPPGVPVTDGWLKESQRLDIPIVFFSKQSIAGEWEKLPEFWNEFPGPAGIYTAALGLSPLEALVASRIQVTESVVKIRVPFGLPDPTPYIPASNPPTYGKWLLGKKLFFDDRLLVVSTTKPTCSCASCHDPQQGFTVHIPIPTMNPARRNVPSLINSVYNSHQFWDGRAAALEEVLVRQLDDTKPLTQEPPFEQSPGYLHVWPGLLQKLSREDYIYAFDRVFGRVPTVDSAAKALATYMRTILSGNSLYDRAESQKKASKAEDFEAALPASPTAKATAAKLAAGYELFMNAARCVKCHPAPLFTDQGFHNIGIGESGVRPESGKEPGRFAATAYGLKHRSQIGAFKTPTLRNLLVTQPYMHDGSLATLRDVLNYFSAGIKGDSNENLDAELSMGPLEARRFHFSDLQLETLELFLGSLQGEEVPRIITDAPRK